MNCCALLCSVWQESTASDCSACVGQNLNYFHQKVVLILLFLRKMTEFEKGCCLPTCKAPDQCVPVSLGGFQNVLPADGTKFLMSWCAWILV